MSSRAANKPGGAIEQHAAGAGQQHAASVADEQLDAQLVFQQLDVPAERRLGRAKPVRRLAEAAELGYGAKSPQLFEIHRLPECSMRPASYVVLASPVQLDQCSDDRSVNVLVRDDVPSPMLLSRKNDPKQEIQS